MRGRIRNYFVRTLLPTPFASFSLLTNDRAVADAGEALDDEPGAGHLGQPVVVGAVQPVVLVLVGRDGEGADLVALPVQLLMQ